jgi:Tol biopolymer transport system component
VLGFFDSPPESQLPLKPISLEKGGQGFPVWSPDGKSIAYAAAERAGEPWRIYIRDLDSPVSRPISDGRNNPGVRQWTTTGRIFFREGSTLYSISPAGVTPESVAGLDLTDVPTLAVARDGTALAIVRREADGSFGIWTTPLPTIALERYEVAPFEMGSLLSAGLEFSPDGRQLLLRWLAPPEQFWLLPFPQDANRPPRRVLENLPPLLGNGLSWLPDNRSVVVGTSDPARTIAPQLSIADTRSGAFRTFTNSITAKAGPSVSPDGERLAYLEGDADYDIVTLSLDDAEHAPLIATTNREEQAAWAADAATMAYLTTRGGHYEVWVRTLGQGDVPLVTPDDFPTRQWLFAPTPSPDGARVIFQTVDWANGASYLWLRSVAGGAPERLTSGAGERAGSWSPDGAWYAYSTREPDNTDTLRRVRTIGGAEPETLLAGIAPSNLRPSWSPDGQWLLVANRGMKLVAQDGRASRDLNIENAPCGFARKESLIYCVRAPQQGRRSFVALDFDGNIQRDIASVPADLGPAASGGQLAPGLALSLLPDGSGVTYSVVHASSSLWLMEGFSRVALP